ncbi:MAG TPA: uroporphyrinogen decarboxylase family protein [Candidatus Hydrogenedentes bacterium]|nr:uroporphyrinogen decarboxylase family protein [Candidatus Hydrogenedentota bacterium]HPG65392.1 uroporphyrinogen decarboxylase family protein [Candidatus Hydrogenedentota bacterium]
MTSRDVVIRTIDFANPERLAVEFPDPYGSDFAWCGMSPSPDDRPSTGRDEWGAVWENIGVCRLGEVKKFPLKDWRDFADMPIPDIRDPRRWEGLAGARATAGDHFLIGGGISVYERVHFIRGLHNTWTDIYAERGNLEKLIGILVDMNLVAIEHYGEMGVDGYMFCDDWGLQNSLMIPPQAWRAIWKPAYARIYGAAHDAGMRTLLHSCGYIVDILDDLIEIGLDVIQMDQQENMGVEALGRRFGGRITFWCPVDIQNTMARGNVAEVRAYCHKLVDTLGRTEGGFMARWYGDPVGAGHTREAIDAMCDEFLAISAERAKAPQA